MARAETKDIRLNPATVQMFTGNDGKDERYYFRNGSIYLNRSYQTPGIDFAIFQNVGPSWSPYKDKNNVYDDDMDIIEEADPKTTAAIYDQK